MPERRYRVEHDRNTTHFVNGNLSIEEAYTLWNRLMQTPGCSNMEIVRDFPLSETTQYVHVTSGRHHELTQWERAITTHPGKQEVC